LLLCSPVILSTYALLLVANRGGALFFQVRPGHQSDLFVIIKFKTMQDGADAEGNLLPDEVRLTSIGKVVRALSIDELLQLINALKGDMSLVGPRPLLTQYLSRYTVEQVRHHNIEQGLQDG
jgi:undecaprenyl phosphate N,N'-diacetylbacillosamine 1-phosphate transferase